MDDDFGRSEVHRDALLQAIRDVVSLNNRPLPRDDNVHIDIVKRAGVPRTEPVVGNHARLAVKNFLDDGQLVVGNPLVDELINCLSAHLEGAPAQPKTKRYRQDTVGAVPTGDL